jgi:hypothetical protein
MWMLLSRLSWGLATTLFALPVLAEVPVDVQNKQVLQWLEIAHVRDNVISSAVPLIVAYLRADDVDGVPGLGRGDAELRVMMAKAGRGLEKFQELLSNDLNGDLQIDRAEAEAVAQLTAGRPLRSGAGIVLPDASQRAALVRQIADLVMAADMDRNGVVSEAELRGVAPGPSGDATEEEIARQTVFVIARWADANGDGEATPAELADAVGAILNSIDTDANGQISKPEIEAAR